MNVDAEKLDHVIGRVYDAALDGGCWPVITEEVMSLFRGSGALLMIRPSVNSQPGQFASAGIDPDAWQRYQDHFYSVDVWGESLARFPEESVSTSDQMIARRLLKQTEWFNDFLRPIDIEDVLVLRTAPENTFTTLSIYKNKAGRGFQARERELLEVIAPHFRRAVRVHLQLGTKFARVRANENLLESLNLGVVLLDRTRRIKYANTAAQLVFYEGDGISVRHGCLIARRNDDDDALQRNLGLACRGSFDFLTGRPDAGVVVQRPSGRRPYVVFAMPLKRSDRSSFRSDCTGLALIRDPDQAQQGDLDALQRAYGLTRSEARMLRSLLAGDSVSDYADHARITLNTARWRLKQIFAKTGCRSQSELIRLVLRSSIPAR